MTYPWIMRPKKVLTRHVFIALALVCWLPVSALSAPAESQVPSSKQLTRQSISPPLPTATTRLATPLTTPLSTTTAIEFFLPSPAPRQPTSTVDGGQGAATTNSTLAAIACPPPLVNNALNSTSGFCMGPCCLPCPVSSVFYTSSKLSNLYTLCSILHATSTAVCGFLAICYMVLPSRRKHPHLIVLCFATAMVPWEGVVMIWMFKKEQLICKNEFEVATLSNSWLCGLQGIDMRYASLSLARANILCPALHTS